MIYEVKERIYKDNRITNKHVTTVYMQVGLKVVWKSARVAEINIKKHFKLLYTHTVGGSV